jgi:hypothetical protein
VPPMAFAWRAFVRDGKDRARSCRFKAFTQTA